jgi:hypothetical protein
MAREPRRSGNGDAIDISASPDVQALAEEVARTRKPRAICRDGVEIAIVVPVPRVAHRRPPGRRRKPISPTDSLFRIVGLFETQGPGDVSANVDGYLAEAYYAESHPSDEQ